jgi:hypothetical protein
MASLLALLQIGDSIHHLKFNVLLTVLLFERMTEKAREAVLLHGHL